MTWAEATATLRSEKRALEEKIDPEHFDVQLSRRLDDVLTEIEALESGGR
jgi:hypothetical protein